jgi:hypothetical protein
LKVIKRGKSQERTFYRSIIVPRSTVRMTGVGKARSVSEARLRKIDHEYPLIIRQEILPSMLGSIIMQWMAREDVTVSPATVRGHVKRLEEC